MIVIVKFSGMLEIVSYTTPSAYMTVDSATVGEKWDRGQVKLIARQLYVSGDSLQ